VFLRTRTEMHILGGVFLVWWAFLSCDAGKMCVFVTLSLCLFSMLRSCDFVLVVKFICRRKYRNYRIALVHCLLYEILLKDKLSDLG
jgi:hypothetical protein